LCNIINPAEFWKNYTNSLKSIKFKFISPKMIQIFSWNFISTQKSLRRLVFFFWILIDSQNFFTEKFRYFLILDIWWFLNRFNDLSPGFSVKHFGITFGFWSNKKFFKFKSDSFFEQKFRKENNFLTFISAKMI